jgi:hypothetical protein
LEQTLNAGPNPYDYVSNDPTNLIDPSGLWGWNPAAAWGALTDAQRMDWGRLASEGWRIVSGSRTQPYADISTVTDNINVDVKDQRAIELVNRGVDIQWEDNQWMVDSTGKLIWIDHYSDAKAAGILGQIVTWLEAGRNSGYNVDLHSGDQLSAALTRHGLGHRYEQILNHDKTTSLQRVLLNVSKMSAMSEDQIQTLLVRAAQSAKANVTSGPYGHLSDRTSVEPGRLFQPQQKARILNDRARISCKPGAGGIGP